MKVHQLQKLLSTAPPFAEVVMPDGLSEYFEGIRRVVLSEDKDFLILFPNSKTYWIELDSGETYLWEEAK